MRCIKCGSMDIFRQFRPKGSEYERDDMDAKNPYAREDRDAWECMHVKRDHISHHCRCCQYEWLSLPLSEQNPKLTGDNPV